MSVFREHVPLAPYTTMGVGGSARFFTQVASIDDLREVLSFAREKGVPHFILAGGSNVLFADDGFAGLVIAVTEGAFSVKDDGATAWAGVPMKTLVDATIERGLRGLEWAGGLPGSVGGAVRGNAGAFGGEIKDSVREVQAMLIDTGEEKLFSGKECQFGYRESFFKHHSAWFIAEVVLQLQKGGDQQTLRAEADDHIRYRTENHPQEPNCGSMFKNVLVEDPNDLPEELRSVPSVAKYGKIGAGVLIGRCGLKGDRVGNMQISELHANHIINLGGGKTSDVLELLKRSEKAVRARFSIDLEREAHVVCF